MVWVKEPEFATLNVKHPHLEVNLHICKHAWKPIQQSLSFVRKACEKLPRTLQYKVHGCQRGLSKSSFHRLSIDLFAFKT